MGLGNFFYNVLQSGNSASNAMPTMSINDVDPMQGMMDPWTLGVHESPELPRRTRKELYTLYKIMGKDPTLSACLNLLTTAALGGHEARGQVVFISAADNLLGNSRAARDMRRMIDREKHVLEEKINSIIYPLCRQAIQYGDSYTRMYGEKKHGIVELLCNEYTESPWVQPYEQGGRTIGYHILEKNNYELSRLTKVTLNQMARMKMQRVSPVPQFKNTFQLVGRILADDNLNNLPGVPAEVGGSFLQDAEEPWRKAIQNMAALDSQQIADSVLQSFITFNVEDMPANARQNYRNSLIKMFSESKDVIEKALRGGEAIYQRHYHLLPTWGDKQIMNALGDVAQRSSPLSIDYLMLHMRRMAGVLGIDISLVGWADMLAGGLGDGSAFHTNAQVMQRSMLIRQASTVTINHITNMHFGFKYGRTYKPGAYPWKIEYYSDISAAASEALNNKNTRAGTMMIVAQAIAQLKELGLSQRANFVLLTSLLGLDDEQAMQISQSLSRAIDIDRIAQNQNYKPDAQEDLNQDATDLDENEEE